jgi:hypothetical protein
MREAGLQGRAESRQAVLREASRAWVEQQLPAVQREGQADTEAEMTYARNVLLWLRGWARFDEISFKPGWSAKSIRWWLLYGLDIGANVVLLAGQVETISRHAQDHRSGKVWDFLLDILEKFDADHGPRSGGPLWDSELPPKWQRIAVPLLWLGGALWLAAS